MRTRAALTAVAVVIAILGGGAAPLRAQLQAEAGFIPIEGSVSYFQFGSYFNRLTMRTSPARIWYTFQPADEEAEAKPLFVFFNGGPGGATSCGLFTANTAKLTVFRDEVTGEAAIVTNPASWTRAGNLLHLDARTAGFSYSLMTGPGSEVRRGREFDLQNYNPFVDGADFVRVLLRFLADHPSIRANRVVLVPESYGGTRTTVMLSLLLYYGRYSNGGSVFQDPALVAAIQAHHNAVFPGYAGAAVPPAIIAGQWGHQILIQTTMSWHYQRRVMARMLEEPGSLLYQVAAETGVPYVLYEDSPGAIADPAPADVMNYIHEWLWSVGRDAYHIAKPAGYFNAQRTAATEFLTGVGTLNLLTGVDVTGITGMYASARADAYKTRAGGSGGGVSRVVTAAASRPGAGARERTAAGKLAAGAARAGAGRSAGGAGRTIAYDFSALVGPPPRADEMAAWIATAGESEMAAVFGTLRPWDRYFVGTNPDVTSAFAWNKATLRNYPVQYNNSELYGRMFLENAAWVETFATNAAWDSVVYTAAVPEGLALHADILSGAQLDAEGPPGAARPGRIVLNYLPAVIPGSTVASRTIRFPSYLMSGHAVTMTEPMEMLDDVVEWLALTGVPAKRR